MTTFVQIEDDALNVDCIAEVELDRDDEGKEVVMIYATHAETPSAPYLTLHGDVARRFLSWWNNKADVYRC